MFSDYTKINRVLAGLAFLLSFIIYITTMAPTTSFWDCGEFIATSVIMGVPHPPGTPLFLLIGNLFSNLPTYADIGARVNLISPIASALAVALTYLIVVMLVEEWRGPVKNRADAIIAYSSGFLAAMTFAVTDSHWFNAVEAEVYSLSTFLTAIVVWLILRWARNEGKAGNVRYILIIAYIFGLAIGIHLLNLLALPFIALIIYYKKHKFTPITFLYVVGLTGLVFLVIYQGIIKGLPFLADQFGLWAPIAAIVLVFAGAAWSIWQQKFFTATIFASLVLILMGFSTYTTIFIRANQRPAINENNPDTFERAVKYMNREQYGEWSIIDRSATLQRPECSYWKRYTLNRANPSSKEVFNFFWEYQVKEMYMRYFAWQFVGRGDLNWPVVNLKGTLIKYKEGINLWRYGLPLAFLLGLYGMINHLAILDRKRGLAVLALFIMTGLLIVVYLNKYDPQPRERDYSYVGSFFAFSLWIGVGIADILQRLQKLKFGSDQLRSAASLAVVGLLLILMPVRMLAEDHHEHDRKGNFVAWDYAYNMLNSCEPNAILFTNGDNDTFPLWYLQEVRGIRKDVRVVNLSLLNTTWYAYQLRDDAPRIPLKMSDKDIDQLMPIPWESNDISIFGVNKKDEKMVWRLDPTFMGRYLRVQDLMIYRIIKDVKWERPIYFAVTVSPDNQIGLDKYLQMEGLVYRVNPTKVPEVNYDRMKQLITQTDDLTEIIETAEDWEQKVADGGGIYRYRNLDNSDVFFSHNVLRLIQNYRSGFLRLALDNVYSQRPDRQEATYRLLKEMDRYFPTETLPINNPDLEIQIARMYKEAGDLEEFEKRLWSILEYPGLGLDIMYYIGQMFINDLNDPLAAVKVFKPLHANPEYAGYFEIMIALVHAYAQAGEADSAQTVLENWLMLNPNDKEAREMLDLLMRERGSLDQNPQSDDPIQ